MTVLIVGGSGFLGAELVRQAVSAGHEVAATYASRPGGAGPLDVRLDSRATESRLRTRLRGAREFLTGPA